MSMYIIRTQEGVELGPIPLEQVEEFVKQGRVRPTSLIFTQESNRWHLAASLPEVRELLRNFQPKLNSAIKRIRSSEYGIPSSKADSRIRKSIAPSKSRKRHSSVIKPLPLIEASDERYTIRASDGVEYGPSTYEELKILAKQGRIKATTMVFTKSSNRWHLAASVTEVRALLRKYNPGQDSILNRIRSMGSIRDSAHALMQMGRISTVRVKHPFWKRLFSRGS